MPMDAKRKVHQNRPHDTIDPRDDCFMMRATGELFADYEQYLGALFEYQTRKWACSVSGKAKLSFEEAQLSERNAQRKVDASFPAEFLEPLCRMVHMSQRRMDELVDAIFKRLSCFRNGEDVEWMQGDGKQPLLVTVVRPVDVDDDFFTDVDIECTLPSRYIITTGVVITTNAKVEEVDDGKEGGSIGDGVERAIGDAVVDDGAAAGGKGLGGADEDASSGAGAGAGDVAEGDVGGKEELEEFEVSAEELRRLRGFGVSRMTIRSKLKVVGLRENYWQAPFICNPDLVRELGLQAEMPPHIKRLKLANDVKTGKLRKEDLAAIDPALAAERAKKRRRSAGPKDESDPLKIVKRVLQDGSPTQRRVWEATSAVVKQAADPLVPVGVQDIASALYADWSSGNQQLWREVVGDDLSAADYAGAAHSLLTQMLATWPASDGEQQKPLLMPPLEDSMLPADDALGTRPEPLTSLFVPDTDMCLPAELLGKTLLIWDFVTRFDKILKVSAFALEDLVGALCCEEECVLARELHCGLLRFLLHQHYEEIRLREEEERLRKQKQREKIERDRLRARGLGAEDVSVSPLALDEQLQEDLDEKGAGVWKAGAKGRGGEKVERGLTKTEIEDGKRAGEEDEEELPDGAIPMPRARTVEDQTWADTLRLYVQARTMMREESEDAFAAGGPGMEQLGPGVTLPPERLMGDLAAGGYESLSIAQRVELLEFLVEDACETGAVKTCLDGAISSISELSSEMREEEKKLREQKRLANLKKKEEKKGKPGAGKADNDAESKPEYTKEYEDNLKKEFEKALENHQVRVLPLGSDRDRRTYWLLNTRENRVFVHDPLLATAPGGRAGGVEHSTMLVGNGHMEGGAEPTAENAEASQMETDETLNWWAWPGGGQQRAELPVATGGAEAWGFYERIDQVDALIASLNPNGLREGRLYEQLSNRYLKLTGNMRKKEKEKTKEERDQIAAAAARRSTRIAAEVATKQMAFMTYRNYLKPKEYEARSRKIR